MNPHLNKKISFGLLLLLAQLFMFFNSETLFGEEFAEEYGNAMLGYLIFYFAFFASLISHPAMNMTLTYSLPRFGIFFIIGVIGAGLLGVFTLFQVELEPTVNPAYIKGVFIYQVVFVSNVEECIFRAILPRILPSVIFLGIPINSSIFSSLIFGFFHFGSYYYLSQQTGQSLAVLMITATLAGLMFQFVRNKFGLPASMGLHAGINIANLGVL